MQTNQKTRLKTISTTILANFIPILGEQIYFSNMVLCHFVSNNAKGWISKRALQENKARQNFWKTNISYPWYAHVCVEKYPFFGKFGVFCFLASWNFALLFIIVYLFVYFNLFPYTTSFLLLLLTIKSNGWN